MVFHTQMSSKRPSLSNPQYAENEVVVNGMIFTSLITPQIDFTPITLPVCWFKYPAVSDWLHLNFSEEQNFLTSDILLPIGVFLSKSALKSSSFLQLSSVALARNAKIIRNSIDFLGILKPTCGNWVLIARCDCSRVCWNWHVKSCCATQSRNKAVWVVPGWHIKYSMW
mgnify:CR=1 FL=1